MGKFAFAWYKPEDWNRLLEISDDSETLENSYQEWLTQANESFNQARKSGMDVTKIFIDLDELIEWCNTNEYKVDSESRSEFAAYKLQKLFSH